MTGGRSDGRHLLSPELDYISVRETGVASQAAYIVDLFDALPGREHSSRVRKFQEVAAALGTSPDQLLNAAASPGAIEVDFPFRVTTADPAWWAQWCAGCGKASCDCSVLWDDGSHSRPAGCRSAGELRALAMNLANLDPEPEALRAGERCLVEQWPPPPQGSSATHLCTVCLSGFSGALAVCPLSGQVAASCCFECGARWTPQLTALPLPGELAARLRCQVAVCANVEFAGSLMPGVGLLTEMHRSLILAQRTLSSVRLHGQYSGCGPLRHARPLHVPPFPNVTVARGAEPVGPSLRHDRELGLVRPTRTSSPWCCRWLVGPGGADDNWEAADPDAVFIAGGQAHRVGAGVPMWVVESAVDEAPLSIEALVYCGELTRRGALSDALLTLLCDISNPELGTAEGGSRAGEEGWAKWLRTLDRTEEAVPASLSWVAPSAPVSFDAAKRTLRLPRTEVIRRPGGIVLAPPGTGKSHWIRALGPNSPWRDGDLLVDWPPGCRATSRLRARHDALRVAAIEEAVEAGHSVLVSFGNPDVLERWRDEGRLVGVWGVADPDFPRRRLTSGVELSNTQRQFLPRYHKIVREWEVWAPVVCDTEHCTLPRSGLTRVSSAGSRSAEDAVRCICSHSDSLFTKKVLAPAFADVTPGPPPPQACLCPLSVACDAILAVRPADQVLAELLRLVGQPYDFACAMLLFIFGVSDATRVPQIRKLLRLPMPAFHSLAKDLSGLVKRWGVPPTWPVRPECVAELHCLGARGIGAINVREEQQHRQDRTFAVPVDEDSIANLIASKLDSDLRPGKRGVMTPNEFMDLRALWVSGGSQPSGAASLPAGAIEVNGLTAPVRFRHTKKSWVETIPSDYLQSVLAGPPRLRATFSVKINDPSKVRVLYGCDSESYLAYSYVLAPVEAALDRSDMLLKPGAADELSAISERLQALSRGVGFMFDFDDFNSQHSYAAMRGVFSGLLRSRWCRAQSTIFQEAVQWCIDALDDVQARYPDGGVIRQPLGLMSGWRATSFVNTLLNWAYLKLAATRAGITEALTYTQHAGDDVFAIAAGRVQISQLMAAIKGLGARGNEGKIAISRNFGEFLRCRYSLSGRGVSGYPARPIASLATGNFMGSASLDPLGKACEVAEHVATCVTRGLATDLGEALLYRLARYWSAVRAPDGNWVPAPDAVLFAPRQHGGLGIVGSAGRAARWWKTRLPDRPSAVEQVRVADAPSMASDDAIAYLKATLADLNLTREQYDATKQLLLQASYTGSAVAALRAKLRQYSGDSLLKWYRACAQIPGPSALTGARLLAATTDDDSPHSAVSLLTHALTLRAPRHPRLYGVLSRVAGLRDAVQRTAFSTPAAARLLVQILRPEAFADFCSLAAQVGDDAAGKFAWGDTDTSFIAIFGLSRLVRDYAWLLYHIDCLTQARLQRTPPPPASAYALSVVGLRGRVWQGIGPVTA